jgi:hypothetical protein
VYGGPRHRLIVPWPEDGAKLPDDWNGIEDSCNRRLIASAPALLAACKALLRHPHVRAYLPYDPTDTVMLAAIAAIAKAEG